MIIPPKGDKEISLYEIDANSHSYAINKLITSNGVKDTPGVLG
jgi:hypothetical protein